MLGKALTLASITALSLVGAALAGDDTNSANDLMPGCRAMINDMDRLGGHALQYGELVALKQGICMSLIDGLDYEASWSKGLFKKAFFCIPTAVTLGQKIRVVVAYIDKHPETMHEDFRQLAMSALIETWPCKD
jgi:Rap1a immunity proteins